MILAEIITIGDEILYGQTLDTNSHWISGQLDSIGIKVIRKSSVGDKEEEILQILQEAEKRVNIILITGGLGPTKDDITKKTLAKFFNTQLILNQEALNDVTGFFAQRGKELTDTNKQQAYLPENCTFISNKMGTAPGMWFEKEGKAFISMPGVPHEMKHLMEEAMLPRLQKKFQLPIIYHKHINTIGVGESYLADTIAEWEKNLPQEMKLAYLPSIGMVKLRITAVGKNHQHLEEQVQQQLQNLMPLLKENIYGYDQDAIEQIVGQLLVQQGKTIATAESCTGGYLAHSITKNSGASAWFKGGIVSYCNEVKESQLGVKHETLEKYGAVSEQTVKEMAENARKYYGATIGIATSGIAGPNGGTPEKPVGTIWIAYADEKETLAKKLTLGNDRTVNIQQTVVYVLDWVRRKLQLELSQNLN